MTHAPRWRRLLMPSRRNLRAEVDEELRFHMDMKVHELVALGMDRTTAEQHAAESFGGVDAVRAACVRIDERKQRRNRRGDVMSALLQDIRYAFRNVRATPTFTVIVALTLAIGIGANTAIFSLVDGVLLKPLPYAQPERLVALIDVQKSDQTPSTFAEFAAVRDSRESTFSEVAALFQTAAVLTGSGDPVSLTGARMSWSLPRMLGVAPLAGRAFAPDDDPHTAPRTVMISERLWRERFNADPAVVGRSITLNGNPFSVLGIYPAGGRSVLPFGYVSTAQIDFWLPMRMDPTLPWLQGLHFITMIGQLKPGATLGQAKASVERTMKLAQAADITTHTLHVEALESRMLRDVGRYLSILLGAVVFVLLIACVNVANLLLARGATRQREIAVRVALGAGRSRVISQLLVESVIRAVLGGALGVALAYGGLAAFRTYLPTRLPRFNEVGIDERVMAFLLVVSVVTGLLFGLVPALRASRIDVVTGLREGGRGLMGSIRRDRLRRGLVIGEVALSFMLLVGAGLLIRSLQQMFAVPRGFDLTNALTAYVGLPASRYPDSTRQVAFFETALTSLAALPGVRGVAATTNLPIEGGTNGGVQIEGLDLGPDERPIAEKRIVSTNYFRVLGARMASGRSFDETDRAGSPPVVIVNESFVRRYLPDGNPLGRKVDFSWGTTGMQSIVGVVADIKEQDLNVPSAPAIYIPLTQRSTEGAFLLARVDGDPMNHLGTMRRAVLAIDPNLPLSQVRTLDQVVDDRLSRQRLAASLLGIFSILALVLAAIGVYGVVSYGVAQRTAEIGVRSALGAQSRDIIRLILGQGIALVAVGVLIGVGGAILATRLLASQLFGVTPTDALTFVSAVAVLGLVAAAASAVPSWRATRVDPLAALRQG